MDINITLLGEMLTFAVLLWVMVKYIWPRLTKAIEARQQQILENIEEVKKGREEMALVQQNITEQLGEAKAEAALIVARAQQQSLFLIEESKVVAKGERNKILARMEEEMQLEIAKVKEQLQHQTAELVIAAAEQVIKQSFDEASQRKLIDQIIAGI